MKNYVILLLLSLILVSANSYKKEKIHQMHSRLYNSAYRAWNYKQHIYTGENFLSPMPDKYFDKPVVVLTKINCLYEDRKGLHPGIIRLCCRRLKIYLILPKGQKSQQCFSTIVGKTELDPSNIHLNYIPVTLLN